MKLLEVAILLTSIGGIMGLQCYTCTNGAGVGTDTSACDDPFNTSTTDPNVLKTTCTTGFDTCAKATLSSGGSNLVARTCYSSLTCPAQNGCASGDYGGQSATVCCCSGSLCNGVGSLAANVIATVAIIFMAMFLAR
ncbi:uncharacterized protein LOC110977082 [Acanthaster planci]|uniref:Uncharacterized protein LOC110977082 n=1 Tax=Acanthaster planci TaxID=133434 RepID=A0A8B7Y3Y2_ACAPL|nr:uncharacterized protein LOC110977082 [Acanthaster planci]XP_022086582.1 uncharacterized protein LOC110977082 [Acanthaster planci]